MQMRKQGYAYFVHQPRRIKDLFRIHAVDRERRFEVAKVIKLPLIDYENFILDFVADRQFLEDNAKYCTKVDPLGNAVGIWRCLLVKRKDHEDGILVITSNDAWVGWAAYYDPKKCGQ